MSEINSFSMHSDSTSSVDSERNESMGGESMGGESTGESTGESIGELTRESTGANESKGNKKEFQVPKIINVESRLSEEELYDNCCLNCICFVFGSIFLCWVQTRK